MSTTFSRYVAYCLFTVFLSSQLIANNQDSLGLIKSVSNEPTTIFDLLKRQRIQKITIRTDVAQITAESSKFVTDGFPASLIYLDGEGNIVETSIELTLRGKSRRLYCDFPPLKIKFSKEQLSQRGIRPKHKSLKLVTHCDEGLVGSRNVLKEYLAYRIYNQITDSSLEVQLLEVKYQDTQTGAELNNYAILLEDIDESAERINGAEVEAFGKKWSGFEPVSAQTMAVFQYLIGNHDWDIRFNRNVKFVQQDGLDKLIPVPYDFDGSGFVSAAYAKPNPNFRLESLKQRLFLGKFNNKKERATVIDHFLDKEKAIHQLIEDFDLLDEVRTHHPCKF